MDAVTILHQDRLFPAEPATRAIARKLYGTVSHLPIISPHGHTDARWFAENEPFPDPTSLFIVPDHYIFRMLYSQGIALEDLGMPPKHERSGNALRSRTTYSAAPLPGYGWTMLLKSCSAWKSGCPQPMPTPTTTPSAPN
jgi:glucuronate isomerase